METSFGCLVLFVMFIFKTNGTIKYVFVGYDSCKKGWICMDPKTKIFVASRNVVFDEVSSWYFAKI